MNIDFNNVRRQAVAAYSGLVRTIKSRTRHGTIKIEQREIEDDMENLRQCLVVIALAHVEDDPGFADVLGDEILPSLCDDEEGERQEQLP